MTKTTLAILAALVAAISILVPTPATAGHLEDYYSRAPFGALLRSGAARDLGGYGRSYGGGSEVEDLLLVGLERGFDFAEQRSVQGHEARMQAAQYAAQFAAAQMSHRTRMEVEASIPPTPTAPGVIPTSASTSGGSSLPAVNLQVENKRRREVEVLYAGQPLPGGIVPPGATTPLSLPPGVKGKITARCQKTVLAADGSIEQKWEDAPVTCDPATFTCVIKP